MAELKSDAVNTSPEQWESMDDRSSSLSELEDATEERDIAVPEDADEESASEAENDTEAETERLDISPQKWLTQPPAEETADVPADEMDQDQEDADGAESTGTITRDVTPEPMEETAPKTVTRKRKRAAGLTDPLMTGEDPDEPAAKRSHSSQDLSVADPEEEREHDPDENVDEEIEKQLADGMPTQEPPELEAEVEEEKEEATAEPEETEKRTRPLRVRKGKRKGKKIKESEPTDTASATPRLGPVDGEDVVEEDVEEEDQTAIQEEEALNKRRFALDMLGEVERQFIAFKERHLNEQINHINHELELLHEPDCKHPEYLSMLQCIDDRRTNKVQHEQVLKRYRMQSLRRKIVAERSQFQSQLLQDLRTAREKALEDGYRHFYALQRDRRRWGADETNYMHMFPTKRSTQIELQKAYNLEVSILSGIAKHVGFPSAPDINGLSDTEIENDLQAMKIAHRPFHPIRPILDVARENRVAEERFLEQTPWANPNHPAHMNAMYQPFAASTSQPSVHPVSKTPSGTQFITPASRRTQPDAGGSSAPGQASSASTIEMVSQPNSGVTVQPPNSSNRTHAGPGGEVDSPSVEVKRHGENRRREMMKVKEDKERETGANSVVQLKATPHKDAGGDWQSAMRTGMSPLAVGGPAVSASR